MINASCPPTGLSVVPMDHACGRGIILEVQPSLESLSFYQPAEQPPSDRLPHRHQPDHQSPHSVMDSVDAHHQYKHPHHHHHHHQHHIEQQPFPHHQFHHLPVAGPYLDSSSGFITSDVNSMSCNILPHTEKEKQGLSQTLYADQCTGISVQMSVKPSEDSYVSIKAHEEGPFPLKVYENMHAVPGRHENLFFLSDGRYLQCQLHPAASSSLLVIPRVRLLCSIGGRIMGRPVDGKLRYCGGDTRLISVEHGIRFSDVTAKLAHMHGPGLFLKYQLPGEDLDALVSVSSDEDFQNMLEEYYKMVANGKNSWFRLFLFRNKLDLEASTCFNFSHGRTECRSQVMQRYVDAINGFDAREISEQPTDVLVENSSNGRPSIARGASDIMHTTLTGSCLPMKALLLAPTASPSVPSSPSAAPRQTHRKQCGSGDTCLALSKEQHNPMMPMNGLDTTAPELAQEQHVDVLKCDHNQSHIPGACSKLQQDPPHRRCEAPWVKENAICFTDTEECCAHNHEWQQRAGMAHVDALCGISKACGPIEPQREAHCEYHVVSQPLTIMACHGGQIVNAGSRCEPAAHCYVEGHKQLLHPHHLQQTGPQLLHWSSPIRLQKGPDVGPVCQGFPHFMKEPVHITRSASAKTLGSAPSSPRNFCLGRGCCCHQPFQVDRGINVSLGEHSHSQKPSYLEGHMIRRHGIPFFSGFSDGQDVSFDPGMQHSVPTLEKGLEIDEQEHEAFSRKQAFSRNNTFSPLTERNAKENGVSSFMESMHCHQGGGPPQYQICCADVHNAKGQQLVKSRVFSPPESQVCMGQFDPYSGNHTENVISRGPTHDLRSDAIFERANDAVTGLSVSNGQGVVSVPNAHGASGYAHVHGSNYSPVAGHQDSRCNLSSESFCSTDAIAGSLSSTSLEHTAWVESPPPIMRNDQSKERKGYECFPSRDHMVSSRHLVDGLFKNEALGDTSRSPSFDCKDCHAKVRSIKSSANGAEPNTEISSVLSLNPVAEDKVSTLAKDKTGISYMDGSQSNFDDKFCPPTSLQTFPSRILDSDASRASAALPMPLYDQSPISSISNAPCFSAHGESKTIKLEEEAREPCASNSSPSMASLHQEHGQYQDTAKTDVESTPCAIMEHETKPVSEESRSNSKPSSRHCSKGSEVEEKPLETVPVAQSRETKQIAQEVNVSGPIDACPEDDEKELPATQAETEAIARGLQIIKNDDLEDLKELGSGTYGTVYHGKWRGSDVAIKRIKPSCFMGSPSQQERLISDFWREAGTLSQLHHPNIVAFYGVVPDGPEGTLGTVTEYMVNGSLKQVLVKKDRTIDRRKRLLIAMDAAFGMEYLHSKRIVHFDLKSENLLVNMRDVHRPICKVGDFGLSKVKHQTLVSGGVRGTLPWMAPELLDTKGRVTEKVDVYSFGIVMWELLTGDEPYAKMHCGTIIGGIVHNNLRPTIPDWCDPSWRDLMKRCWSGNPADRPDFPTVANELRAIAASTNVK